MHDLIHMTARQVLGHLNAGDLTHADLTRADLTYAYLAAAVLTETNLTHASTGDYDIQISKIIYCLVNHLKYAISIFDIQFINFYLRDAISINMATYSSMYVY